MNILVVDDEVMICDLLKEEFKLCLSADVDIAHNGKEALEQCLLKKYDLIVLDYKMPIMNGTEFFKELRASDNENRKTPVMVISAFSPSVDEFLDCQIIKKPFSFDHITNQAKALIA